MSKLEQPKFNVEIKPGIKVLITKLNDDVFNGNHPNGIQEGFAKEGILCQAPEVGVSCRLDNFRTSVVTEIIDDTTFKTKNSMYKIEELNKDQ